MKPSLNRTCAFAAIPAALLAAPFAAPLAAAAEPAAPPRIIEAIDEATLRTALGNLNAEIDPLDEEAEMVRALFPNGARAVLHRTACTEAGCKGLLMLGYFRVPEGRSAVEAEAARRDFSANYNPASVIANDLGEHIVKSYVILDGGITEANLTIRLAVFAESLDRYARVLYGEGQ